VHVQSCLIVTQVIAVEAEESACLKVALEQHRRVILDDVSVCTHSCMRVIECVCVFVVRLVCLLRVCQSNWLAKCRFRLSGWVVGNGVHVCSERRFDDRICLMA
jgi:hypothetical protein